MGAGKKFSKKFVESPIHLNRINNLLLQIDRFWNTLKQNENIFEELKQRYIFSDILLLLNDETKDLFLDLRDVLDELKIEDNKIAFTHAMINKVYEIQIKINHVVNKPEDQSEVMKILKSIDEFMKNA